MPTSQKIFNEKKGDIINSIYLTNATLDNERILMKCQLTVSTHTQEVVDGRRKSPGMTLSLADSWA